MKILTITPNPAVDKSTSVEGVQPEKKLRCSKPRFDAGGGGINVARVLRRLGNDVSAIFPAGGYNGELLKDLLAEEGMTCCAVPVKGWTRESFAVLDTASRQQYRFNLPGEPLLEEEWQALLDALRQSEPAPQFIVASGSLPPDVPKGFFAKVAEVARERNARLVLDTSGEALAKGLAAGVFLAKPNLGELAALAGRDALHGEEPVEVARQLVAEGRAVLVAVSLAARGAMLVHKDGVERAAPPTIRPKSTIGAGDSMVAGMTHALAQGKPLAEVLRFGVACGTAATMQEGTGLSQVADIQAVLEWMGGGGNR